MVGNFHGQNDMAARLELLFADMPERVRVRAMESAGASLFMRVRSDGSYFASSLTAGAEVTFLDGGGDVGTMRTYLETYGSIGQFSRTGGDGLGWCVLSGGVGTFGIFGGGSGMAGPVASMNPMETVPMRYVCDGPFVKLFVDLPPPFGTVTYSMQRIAVAPDVIDVFLPEAP